MDHHPDCHRHGFVAAVVVFDLVKLFEKNFSIVGCNFAGSLIVNLNYHSKYLIFYRILFNLFPNFKQLNKIADFLP